MVVGLDLEGGNRLRRAGSGLGRPRGRRGVSRLGGLDALINNAGLGTPQSAAAPPDDGCAGGARRQPPRAVAGHRGRAAGAPRLPRPGDERRYRARPHHRPVLDRVHDLQARGRRLQATSLRLEEGDRITVTTVYPGYIRTRHPPALRRGGRDAGGRGAGGARRGRRAHARPGGAGTAGASTWPRRATAMHRSRRAGCCRGGLTRHGRPLARMRRLARRGRLRRRRARGRVRAAAQYGWSSTASTIRTRGAPLTPGPPPASSRARAARRRSAPPRRRCRTRAPRST